MAAVDRILSIDFYGPCTRFYKFGNNSNEDGPVKRYDSVYFETKDKERFNKFLDSLKSPVLPKKREMKHENE